MAKFQSPLLGYNNNLRHRGRVFHIQTEDSGVNHPHIITHLFMDGGRILKSVKKSYAEHVGTEGMSETVRLLMKEQHKAMFIALRDGQFDHLLEGTKKAPDSAVVPLSTNGQANEPAQPKQPGPVPAVAATVSEPRAVASTATAAARPASGGDAPSTVGEGRSAATMPGAPEKKRAPIEDEIPKTAREPERRTSVAELTLDFDALEQDSHAAGFAREPQTRTYGALGATAHHDSKQSTATSGRAPESQARPTAANPQAAAQKPATEGRYAPARPAAIFGTGPASARQPMSSSIFSDDLVSDKSLDEVILSYLAEDLDPPTRK